MAVQIEIPTCALMLGLITSEIVTPREWLPGPARRAASLAGASLGLGMPSFWTPEEIRSSFDEANAIWKELQAVIYEDQPYAFLYWKNGVTAVHSRFQDTTVDVMSPYRNLHEWWVPPDQDQYAQ